jgi:hypothetical protein
VIGEKSDAAATPASGRKRSDSSGANGVRERGRIKPCSYSAFAGAAPPLSATASSVPLSKWLREIAEQIYPKVLRKERSRAKWNQVSRGEERLTTRHLLVPHGIGEHWRRVVDLIENREPLNSRRVEKVTAISIHGCGTNGFDGPPISRYSEIVRRSP